MTAGNVATYSVPNCPWCGMLSRSKPERHREWETVCMECGSEIYPPRATSPSVQSKACKEIAALRRQLEERGDAAPEFDVNRLDGLEGAWAEGNLRVYIAGARAGWEKCASLIRIPPGEVVATPPPDVVMVPREELEILRDGFGLLRTAWNISGFDERLSAQADALIERHNALRSGESPAQRGEG